MDSCEFFNYIMEHFNLGGAAARLVNNIIEYVKDEDFVDAEDAQTHLKSLLDGAFGITEQEIKLYRAPMCMNCGKYVTDCDEYEDTLRPDCEKSKTHSTANRTCP